ncbi:MAG: NYN domain-containing protein [Rhizobacter sp.]
MNSQLRVMLLIDADNVSADVMEQAVGKVLADRGAIHVRRAYCTPEAALANQKLFKQLSIRPIVNISTGKNSTDILLATDAMDLAISERPDVIVIVSSDSDFAPLVIRLREKGCRVEGIGQLGKTGEDSKVVYDGFVEIEHRKGGRSPAAPPARKRAPARGAKAPARGRAEAPVQLPLEVSEPAPAPEPAMPPAPEPAAKKTTRSRRTKASADVAPAPAPAPVPAPPPARPPMPDDLRSILAVLPELVRGQKMDLGIATERLREEDLLGARAPATRLFRKYPDWFLLTPEQQPNKVEYRGLPKA